MAELQDHLPAGWECRFDSLSGKYYFVNNYTKTTTWDDPRSKHKPFHGTPSKHFSNVAVEHIPLQHGSPDLRRNYVYPSQTSPIPAFQMPAHQSPKSYPLQDFKTISRMSPLTVRTSKVQDSSLTAPCDTDEAIAKISAMFPTVSETHTRMLMKNCRYMKSIFPQAEETVILDVLYNNESNIQKTSEILKDMGFQRKDTVKAAQQKMEAKIEASRVEEMEREAPPAPPLKMKTKEEKVAMKTKLKSKYKDVADQLIAMALESVDFNENRASQILDIMVQEDSEKDAEKNIKTHEIEVEEAKEICDVDSKASVLPISQSRQSIKSLLKSDKIDKDKNNVFSRVVEESNMDYKSPNIINTNGPNPDLIQGPNDKILLDDYVKWQGPNPNLRKGSQILAKGPNRSLLSTRTYQPCGSNADLRKGPKFGLAKGSIFSQLKSVVVGESRGN